MIEQVFVPVGEEVIELARPLDAVVGIAISAVQTIVLGMGLASRHDDDDYDLGLADSPGAALLRQEGHCRRPATRGR